MYGYQYDDLNRLLKGNYRKLGYSVTGNYDETLSYDKHGNIQTLQRNGFADADFGTSVEIDNLVYAYEGNQLRNVVDMSNSLNGFRDNVNNGDGDYTYDVYGNMTSDANKRIEDIDYNHLNLPTVINFQNNSGRIRYTYDALGVKLRKEVDDVNGTTTTDYLDGFQYKNEALIFFPTAEGYVEFVLPTKYFYVYNYTDHLGNVRMSYTDNGTAVPKILEENHYYPFGLKHENYASERFEFIKEPHGTLYVIQPTERREWQYKYNGKEWQDELGLNFYDYGARNYDAAIGRWMNVDPLAEKYPNWSPFIYAINNPTVFVDYDGKDFGLYIDFERGIITIRAKYYTTDKDSHSAKLAADAWNEQNGKFSYNFVDEEGKSQSFVINYEMTVEVVVPKENETEDGALNRILASDSTGEGNIYVVKPDNRFKEGVNGTTNKNYIKVKESRRESETGKHELGHSLGIPHSATGIMTESSNDPNRTGEITSENVSKTLSSIGSRVDAPNKAKSPFSKAAGRATLHLINTENVRAPKTKKGYRKLRNGTVN